MRRAVLAATIAVATLWAPPCALEAQWYSRLGHHGYVTYPSLAEGGVTLSAHYARGLSEDSYRTNQLEGRVELASEAFGIWGGLGWLKPSNDLVSQGGSQIGINGGAGVHLLRRSFQLSLQIGLGYLSKEDQTSLRVPGGPCFAFRFKDGNSTVRPWIMPYIQIQDVNDGSSSRQEGGVGTSGGIEWRLPSGLGFSVALEWSWTDLGDIGYAGGDQSMLFVGFGISYQMD